MAMMILGGTGFIGSRVCKRLVDLGEKVVACDISPSAEALGEYADRITVGRCDKALMGDLLKIIEENDVELIMDLASVLEIECITNPELALQVNIMGMNNVFEAARLMDVQRVIFASSIAAYGHHRNFGDNALDEDNPTFPMTMYGWCKRFCEFLADFYRDVHGMEPVVLRVGSAFGPGKRGGVTAFISDITTLPALGRPLYVPASRSTRLVYSSVDDVAGAFVTAARADSARLKHTLYNVGGFTHTGDEVVDRIMELVPDAEIEFGDMDIYYVYRLDNSRIAEDLGFELEYTMRDGIKANMNETRAANGLPLLV